MQRAAVQQSAAHQQRPATKQHASAQQRDAAQQPAAAKLRVAVQQITAAQQPAAHDVLQAVSCYVISIVHVVHGPKLQLSHEIIVLFVLRKLILLIDMRFMSNFWSNPWSASTFYTSCVRTAKALASQRGCAGSSKPSLVLYVISTLFTWAGSFLVCRAQNAHMYQPIRKGYLSHPCSHTVQET